MRGTKKWSKHKDVFNLHLKRGLRKSYKRLILAPCIKIEASTKSQLNRNHWCFSCVLSGNTLAARSRTTSLELTKWRQNDPRRRRHRLSNGRVSDLNDLHADYSKFSNNCVLRFFVQRLREQDTTAWEFSKQSSPTELQSKPHSFHKKLC